MEPQEKLKRLCLAGGSIFANFEVLRLGSFKILKGPQERPQRPPARPAPTNNVIQEQQIRILVRPYSHFPNATSEISKAVSSQPQVPKAIAPMARFA